MILINLPRPTIFAHRGASAHAPENTLAAFQRAVDLHADAIELDAKLTADGQVIVIHDQTVDRTTNGHGKDRTFTLAEIKALDAGGWKSPAFVGERIPTLAEVFEAVGQKLFINVELTNYSTPNDALVERVVELIHQYQLEERVIFSSFHPVTLLKARRLAPEIPSGILAMEGSTGWLARSVVGDWITAYAVHPYFSDVTEEFVQQQHAKNRRVHVWTVNDPEEMKRLFALEVDGIFTDDPALAHKVLESQ
jgi:glycerophosphoryl diester phosphodiesterase